MTNNSTPPEEIQKADQLDRLITDRQRADLPHQSISDVSTADTALVDSLIGLAATTEPNPDFVAALERRLQNQARSQVTKRSVKIWTFTTRRLAIAAALILCLLIGYLATPTTVRATLWDWLYGVGLLREEQVMDQSFPLEQPSMPPTASTGLTLDEIQERAPFSIQPPAHLPAGLFFTGGFVMPTERDTLVTLAYHLTATPVGGYAPDAPLLFVAISDGEIPNRPLLAEGYQRSIKVGKQMGIYTHGNWSSTAPASTDHTQTGGLVWDDTIDAAWLVWQKDELNYLLYAQGLAFTEKDMGRIAASME